MAYNKRQKLSDNIEAIRIVFSHRDHPLTEDEKDRLSRYSGFGGLKFILYPEGDRTMWRNSDIAYYDMTQELYRLLRENSKDDREYRGYVQSLRNSVMTSFYTPSPVVDSIASVIREQGITVKEFLEPSAGRGIFLDRFSEAFPDSHFSAFEKDLLAGKVLQLSHGDMSVNIAGYETIDATGNGVSRGLYDVISSNIPFGDIKVFDPEYTGSSDEAHRTASTAIHDYFFMKSMDVMRDGGILAFITSRGVMDSPRNETVRRSLISHANLIAAVRLPDGMFRDEAGTDVGSDLIILQKNEGKQSLTPLDALFIKSEERVLEDNPNKKYNINPLFTDGIYYIADKVDVGTDPYGRPSLVYTYDKGIDSLAVALKTKLDVFFRNNFDRNLYDSNVRKTFTEQTEKPSDQQQPKAETAQQPVQLSLFDMWDEPQQTKKSNMEPHPFKGERLTTYRDGYLVVEEGMVGVLSDCGHTPVFTPKDLTPYQSEMLKQYVDIRDTYEDLYQYELENEAASPGRRRTLNYLYDVFVRKYGYFNSRRNMSAIILDVKGRDTLTLETPDATGKIFSKAEAHM